MEDLGGFDDTILRLIDRFSLLDLSRPEEATRSEIYLAAELALQMETASGDASPSAQGRTPAPGRPRGQDRDLQTHGPAGERSPSRPSRRSKQDNKKGRFIGPEERKQLLDESEAEDEADTKAEGEPCMVCGDGSGKKRRIVCRCLYCVVCLRRCIRTGLRNEENFPPKCHQRLTEDDIRSAGRPGLFRLYRQVALEWDTPAADRLYCAKPECAAFIPDRLEGNEARCEACGTGTCASCRKRWHPGLPCEEEKEDEELMDMMDEHGYSACNNCRRIVEIQSGCNHIT